MSDKIQVSQLSENEFLVGTNRTALIEENIIYVVAKGEQTDEVAIAQEEVNRRLKEQSNQKIYYLIDLNECGKNSRKAREIWLKLAEDEATEYVAIFGLHPVAKVIASFVTGLSKRQNERFFKKKEEAVNWLLKLKQEKVQKK